MRDLPQRHHGFPVNVDSASCQRTEENNGEGGWEGEEKKKRREVEEEVFQKEEGEEEVFQKEEEEETEGAVWQKTSRTASEEARAYLQACLWRSGDGNTYPQPTEIYLT